MSKEQTKGLYGIAVIMMLMHHLFAQVDVAFYSSVINALFRQKYLLRDLAVFCKLCVGIYAFVSGFGFCSSSLKRELQISVNRRNSIWGKVICEYRNTGRRFLSLYLKYILVCLAFIPLGYVLGVYEYSSISQVFFALLGRGNYYNGTWWYVWQYFLFCIIYPPVVTFFELFIKKNLKLKDSILVIISALVMSLMFFAGLVSVMNVIYFMVFAVGFLARYFDVISKIQQKIIIDSSIFYTIALLGLLTICFVVRYYTVNITGAVDVILIFPVVYALNELLRLFPRLNRAFSIWGRVSTYMWLVHNFFIVQYGFFVKSFTFAEIRIVLLILISTVVSFILQAVEKFVLQYGQKR